MSELSTHHDIEMGSPRGFGLVFAVVFSLIGLWPLLAQATPRWWALGIAAVFGLLAILAPSLLQGLNRLWFKFGLALGRIVTPIVMGILFFLVFTPMGLLLRAMGKDLLQLKIDKDADTYWQRRDKPEQAMGPMKNQY